MKKKKKQKQNAQEVVRRMADRVQLVRPEMRLIEKEMS